MNILGDAKMDLTVVDLRYKTKEILKAVERGETVNLLYHGKIKAMIVPFHPKNKKFKIEDHPFFGMCKEDKTPISKVMKRLRGSRYND